MIKTENGTVEFDGTRPEIYGDLFAILEAAYLKTPMELYLALETFGRSDSKNLFSDKSEELKRQKMLAAVISAMPEKERELLKKKMEGRQNADD